MIIPHYNSPELLRRCLASIPDKDSIQVVVVDDNSSPERVDFNHFPGSERANTEIVLNKENHGAGHARNLGLAKARGKWLVFADADDFFLPGAWAIFDSHYESVDDIIYFRHTSVDSATLETNDRQKIYGRYFDAYLSSPSEQTLSHLRYRHDIPWGKMIRRELVEEHGITFGETRYCNDTLFSTRTAIAAGRVSVERRATYCVTSDSRSLTHQQSGEALLIRLDVLLTKNQLLRQHHLAEHQPSVLFYFKDALGFGIRTFMSAVCLAYRHKTPLTMIYVYSRLYRD